MSGPTTDERMGWIQLERATPPERGFVLRTGLWLNAPLEEVFDFFSRAENLEALTPAMLKFRIVTPVPIEMKEGALIDYRLRLRGLPMRWRSEITGWDPPNRFVDEQRKGPYRWWHHEHCFTAKDGGTLVLDEVKYNLLGGRLVNRWFVAPDLERIFRFRHEQLLLRFPPKDTAQA